MENNEKLPPALSEIVEDFSWCEGREKLELLVQFSEMMPELPAWLNIDHETMDQVSECMTPVFIHVENENAHLKFYFDVPKESPTVRGFAAIMSKGLDGSMPEEILQIPNDFYLKMGLEKVLTHQRLNGLTAMIAHIKRLAALELEK